MGRDGGISMKNVLFIKGQSRYGSMRNYIDEIEIGFRLAGYNTMLLDSLEQSAQFQLNGWKEFARIDFVFTCNAMNTEIISILPDARYITYLCDHPAFHRQRLMSLNESAVVFTCDIFYAEYVKEFYPNIKNVAFIPLSGSYFKKYIPYQERKYEVVFTGTYQSPQDIYGETLSAFVGDHKDIAREVMDNLVENPNQRLDMCLLNVLELKGKVVSKDGFNRMCQILSGAECYARNYYRDKMIRVLVKNGIKVHVFGEGWESFKSDYVGNLIIERGNSYIAQKVVANAKISINIMPWFKGGFQERIAAAMLSGTVAVTDGSLYIDQNFEDGRELILYLLEYLEELPGKVKWILGHPELAEQIALQGKARAEQEMTWQHRTFEMIHVISNCIGEPFSGYVEGRWGNVLSLPCWEKAGDSLIAFDIRKSLSEILALMEEIQTYSSIEIEDLKYLYTKFLYLYRKIHAFFPDVQVNMYLEECVNHVDGNTLQDAVERFAKECINIQGKI